MIKPSNIPAVVQLDFDLQGEHYYGEAVPLKTSCAGEGCLELDVTLNAEHLGTIYRSQDLKWTLKDLANQAITDKIGEIITQFMAH